MFNFGVFGGACCYVLTDPHGPALVGMSGGCYALLGMHMADIIMNWSEKERPVPKLVALGVIIAVDLLNVAYSSDQDQPASPSFWAHVGGWIFGLLVGVIIGRNVVKRQHERYLWFGGVVAAVGLTIFSLNWAWSWPPQDLVEQVPWCWTRQISNWTIFQNNDYHCVRCASMDCVQTWSSQQWQATVSKVTCANNGGWAVSE